MFTTETGLQNLNILDLTEGHCCVIVLLVRNTRKYQTVDNWTGNCLLLPRV